MLDIVQLPLGAYRTNCYLVAREGASGDLNARVEEYVRWLKS